jgi:hypothetical protein
MRTDALPNSHASSLPKVMARLLSVNLGLPRDVTWQGRTVHTDIWKAPVAGPRIVRRLNVEGDGHSDMNGHGGERRAVFVYQMGSYRYWQNQLGRNDFVYGHRQFPQHSAGLAGLFTFSKVPGTGYSASERGYPVKAGHPSR